VKTIKFAYWPGAGQAAGSSSPTKVFDTTGLPVVRPSHPRLPRTVTTSGGTVNALPLWTTERIGNEQYPEIPPSHKTATGATAKIGIGTAAPTASSTPVNWHGETVRGMVDSGCDRA